MEPLLVSLALPQGISDPLRHVVSNLHAANDVFKQPREILFANVRVRAIIVRAYKQTDVATARRLLQDLARRLEDRYPSAAASVREGLEETLTILTLGLSDRLRQSLATTHAIESLISRTRHVKRNVKRWRGGQMVLRWTAAAVLEAVKGFRRLKGHKDMPKLVAALRARDQQLGIAVSVENVA